MSNGSMPAGYSEAEIAAILELNFGKMDGLPQNASLDAYGLEGFTFVDMGEFERDIYRDTYPDNVGSMKAVTVRGPDGQLYVHFNGTGDGNWGYNSAAYQDSLPSAVQEWSLNYFNSMVEKHGGNRDIYVSGHSQGGNNAQFVTMRSAYGERIKRCISLDGPGFSNRFVEDTKRMYGDGYFESQRQKIYGYHGKSDFVSPLGQQDIIPKDHVHYLDYGDADGIVNYHAIEGLFAVDSEGKMILPPRLKGLYGDGSDCSDFRKLVIALADRVKELPQDQQERAAEIVMKLCENMGGGEKILAEFTDKDLADLKTMLVPLLVDAFESDPELVISTLREMDAHPEIVLLVEKFLGEFNGLSPEVRREALDFIMEYVVVKDGGVDFKWPLLLADAWDEIRNDPANAWAIIQKYHLDDVLIDYMAEHPVASVAVIVFSVGLLVFAPQLVGIVIAVLDILSGIVHAIELLGEIGKFVSEMVKAIKETIEKIRNWIRNTFNRGVKYAQQNPWFRADTARLRDYAERLRRVNRRLADLDGDVRSLYWQVGLLDLWDILAANLITSWSVSLQLAQSYLSNTADRLEDAENKARQMLGG